LPTAFDTGRLANTSSFAGFISATAASHISHSTVKNIVDGKIKLI
jgi:hypothetical protein